MYNYTLISLSMQVTVIGVAGGTGSGKSTLVKRLQEAFKGDDVVTLCHDFYYKAHSELTYEERTKLNYDHPQAFDTHMPVSYTHLAGDDESWRRGEQGDGALPRVRSDEGTV